MNCVFSQMNKFNKVVCTLNKDGKPLEKGVSLPICPFQRYCGKDMKWENTSAITNCERRIKNGRV